VSTHHLTRVSVNAGLVGGTEAQTLTLPVNCDWQLRLITEREKNSASSPSIYYLADQYGWHWSNGEHLPPQFTARESEESTVPMAGCTGGWLKEHASPREGFS